jgi:hypothetical protein
LHALFPAKWCHFLQFRAKLHACNQNREFHLNLCLQVFKLSTLVRIEAEIIGFANHFRRLFAIAHGDEGAMPQMSSIRPFNECNLTDEFRFNPAAVFHFLCG